MSMIGDRKKALEYVFYIHYPVQFKDISEAQVQALVDWGNEVNAIHPTFTKQLGLSIRSIDIGAQKIDSITLDIYGMVIAAFSLMNKANRVRFFEETFLMANVSPEVVLKIFFLTLSGADVDFSSQELWWKTYTTKKALLTTRRVELIGKKEFAAAVYDSKHET